MGGWESPTLNSPLGVKLYWMICCAAVCPTGSLRPTAQTELVLRSDKFLGGFVLAVMKLKARHFEFLFSVYKSVVNMLWASALKLNSLLWSVHPILVLVNCVVWLWNVSEGPRALVSVIAAGVCGSSAHGGGVIRLFKLCFLRGCGFESGELSWCWNVNGFFCIAWKFVPVFSRITLF